MTVGNPFSPFSSVTEERPGVLLSGRRDSVEMEECSKVDEKRTPELCKRSEPIELEDSAPGEKGREESGNDAA